MRSAFIWNSVEILNGVVANKMCCQVQGWGVVNRYFTQKLNFCHHLLILMLFQIGYFLYSVEHKRRYFETCLSLLLSTVCEHQTSLVTNILQNIFFMFRRKKDSHTGWSYMKVSKCWTIRVTRHLTPPWDLLLFALNKWFSGKKSIKQGGECKS